MPRPGSSHLQEGWMDPHQAAKVGDRTLELYRHVAAQFAMWCFHSNLDP